LDYLGILPSYLFSAKFLIVDLTLMLFWHAMEIAVDIAALALDA
jgi:hypothetical protein